MRLVVVSPEQARADEAAVVSALFAAGLERYHVRKPHASAAELEAWIESVPPRWRGRLILHQHHELVPTLGLGGFHWKEAGAVSGETAARKHAPAARPEASPYVASRSCHDLATVRASLGRFDAVFFGPVFPSISKPGYAPKDVRIGETLGALLLTRDARERRTAVIAIGGVTAETVPRAHAVGFDGVAVLGAVWQAPDPVAAFRELQFRCGDPDAAVTTGSGGRARRPRRAAAHRGPFDLPQPDAGAAATGTAHPATAPGACPVTAN